jgi:GABA permease
MRNYLIVAHQTADSEELASALLARQEQDKQAEFVLLVPATRIDQLGQPLEQDSHANAERVGLQAAYSLHGKGLRLTRVTVGDESPIVAIQEEVASRPGYYQEIVISTLPVDFSKWLTMGVPETIKATFNLPVTHVYGRVPWIE